LQRGYFLLFCSSNSNLLGSRCRASFFKGGTKHLDYS
jgi:hypothetical protein